MFPLIALALALLAAQTPAVGAQTPDSTTPPPPTTDQARPPRAPRPNPDASGKYHVGDGVVAPRVVHQTEPQFSKEARKQKINGIVLVALTVDADGNPTNVHVLRSMADTVKPKLRKAALSLDDNAVEAVKTYRFTPATLNGQPVAVQLNVEINFQIF